MELHQEQCVPCAGGVAPLKAEALAPFLAQVQGWVAVDGHHLLKTYSFPDFKEALAFVNQLGEIAEQQGHHPDVHLSWGRVAVELFTHSAGGLTPSDFILAAKFDRLRPG